MEEWQVDSGYACAWVATENDIIVSTAPIFRRLIGQKIPGKYKKEIIKTMMQGVVKKILNRPWQDKTFHSFTLESDDRIFNTGTRKVTGIAPGMVVEFDVTKNPKGYWDVDTKTAAVKEQVRAPQAPAAEFNNKQDKNSYWETKDRVIELQSCRNSAIDLARLLLDREAITFKAKEDKFAVVTALVAKLTKEFVQDNEQVRNPQESISVPEEGTQEAPESPQEEEWKE